MPLSDGSPTPNAPHARRLPSGDQTMQPISRSGSGDSNHRTTSPVSGLTIASAVVQSGGFWQERTAISPLSGDQRGTSDRRNRGATSVPSGSIVNVALSSLFGISLVNAIRPLDAGS